MNEDYKISIIGAGYVGMSLACLFSQQYTTTVFDISEEKVNKVNNRESTIGDQDIEKYLQLSLNIPKATTDFTEVLNSDFVVICTPTNYDENTNQFDCSSVEKTIEKLEQTNATIVIKSTIPIGFTKRMREKYHTDRILFSPEFLREGKALYDNLHPSRIVVSEGKNAMKFAKILKGCSEDNPAIIVTGSDEAESIKLFSNTYLAMRVAFFNELDSFAMYKELRTEDIIEGVCLDKRIGSGYNNPSFGYGGYCLPKDTKQLKYHYNDTFNSDLIDAIVNSNETRKMTIVEEIKKKVNKKATIGIYRLAMKSGSDNSRHSASLMIMNELIKEGYGVVVYEPSVNDSDKYCLCNDIDEFKEKCDLIVANRNNKELSDVEYKVFSRDVFGDN